ncbi:unnamed protein product, partial [Mesorhabditis spiculigera]
MSYLQLVHFDNGAIKINERVLRDTIFNAKYRGYKVRLVSVVGPSRTGKSFLVSFLSQYTLGTPFPIITGDFKSGYERVTTGIHILSQPQLYKTDAGTHAVFLLDTQGTFDLQTELYISEWIMAFSLLVSDTLIFNVRVNVDGDHLRILHRAAQIADSIGQGKISQDLLFLVRDAAESGVKGQEFLDQLWSQNSASNELADARDSLKNLIGKIGCILTPPPTRKTQSANGLFRIQGKEDQLFIESLVDTIHYIKNNGRDGSALAVTDIEFWKNTAKLLEDSVQDVARASAAREAVFIENACNEVFTKLNIDQTEAARCTNLSRYYHAKDHEASKIIGAKYPADIATQIHQGVRTRLEADFNNMVQLIQKEDEAKRRKQFIDAGLRAGRTEISKLSTIREGRDFYLKNRLAELAQNDVELELLLRGILKAELAFCSKTDIKHHVADECKIFRNILSKIPITETLTFDGHADRIDFHVKSVLEEIGFLYDLEIIGEEEFKKVEETCRAQLQMTLEAAVRNHENLQKKQRQMQPKIDNGVVASPKPTVMESERSTANPDTQVANNARNLSPETEAIAQELDDWQVISRRGKLAESLPPVPKRAAIEAETPPQKILTPNSIKIEGQVPKPADAKPVNVSYSSALRNTNSTPLSSRIVETSGSATRENIAPEVQILRKKLEAAEKEKERIERKDQDKFLEITGLKKQLADAQLIFDELPKFRDLVVKLVEDYNRHPRILDEVRREKLRVDMVRLLRCDQHNEGLPHYKNLQQERENVASHTFQVVTGHVMKPVKLMFSDIDKVVKECGRMSVVLRIDNELNLALQEILGYMTDGIVTYLPNIKERIRRADANFAKERLPFYVELSVSQSLQNNVDMFYMEHGEKEWLYSEEAKISAEDRDLLMTLRGAPEVDQYAVYNYIYSVMRRKVLGYPNEYPLVVASRLCHEFRKTIYDNFREAFAKKGEFYEKELGTVLDLCLICRWAAQLATERGECQYLSDVFDYVTAGLDPTKENADWTKLVRKAIARGDNSYRFIGFSLGYYLDKAVGELKELIIARINPGSTKSRKKTLIN